VADDESPVRRLEDDLAAVDYAIREGRFQRWLSLVAGLSSVLSGLEVSYEHYRGSYSQRAMYTPVALSGALLIAGVAGFANRRAATTLLPAVSALTLADAALGFYFHVRGIARKPGGWGLPVTNIVMGPPIFAPLLFGVSAYLGLVASQLRRSSDGSDDGLPRAATPRHWSARMSGMHEPIDAAQDRREHGFQRQMAVATAFAAVLSGLEAWYSHYKNNFRYGVQWTPLAVAAVLTLAALGATRSRRIAHTVLPAASLLAIANGTIGFGYHVRGVLRRPGGLRKPLYNLMYGPPVFAPLLFAASGFLGVLASLLRRSDS
jgi:hypothetical protein